MNRCTLTAIVLGGLLASATPVLLSAQPVPTGQMPNQASPPPYRPGLGDLMTMTVQPRHLKLGLAGRERNWVFAAYELHELEESFERVTRYWPQWRKKPIPEMMTSLTKEPMAALEQAIKSADTDRFTAAYVQLTEACNTCHQSAEVGVIVIQVPEASPFQNQDFRPSKR
jgi:hypothetical protein